MVGDVSGLSLVGSCLWQFKISTLGYVCHALSMSYFLYLPLWCQHDVWSAQDIRAVIAILFSEEYMWEQEIKGIRLKGVSQAVVKIVINNVFHKILGIEWIAEQLLASQEGLFLVTLIVIHCNDFDSYKMGNLQISYSIIRFDASVYHSLSWQRSH